MGHEKRLARTNAVWSAADIPLSGYEIHLGTTQGPACERPFLRVGDRAEGAVSPDGRIMGCYLHGLFASDTFRTAFLAQIGLVTAPMDYGSGVQKVLDDLAEHIETHLDVDALLALAAPVQSNSSLDKN
jgi:adenosylcobyric acid synthase